MSETEMHTSEAQSGWKRASLWVLAALLFSYPAFIVWRGLTDWYIRPERSVTVEKEVPF